MFDNPDCFSPPPRISKPFILPHGLDSLLEERIVAARGQSAGQLDVVVESPEVLDLRLEAELRQTRFSPLSSLVYRVECNDLPLVFLPLFGLVIFEEP